MNQDYHIPYDELVRLKEIQQKIAKDGKDLEERFRLVSNQIMRQVIKTLKDTSPTDIGNEFPSRC